MITILMISTDRKIFEAGSEVKSRMVSYATAMTELFVVILGAKRDLRVENNLKFIGLTRWQAFWWRPKKKFDLVTAQDPFETGLIAWRLAKVMEAKLELQIHTDFLSPRFARRSWPNWLRVKLAKFLLSKADKVRVVSRRIADSLKANHYALKTIPEIRPIAVDLAAIKSTPLTTNLHEKYRQFSQIVLMASRLEPEKNIALALKAWPKVLATIPKAVLVIVGSGSEAKRLKQLASKLKIDKNIIFEPWVDKPTLISYYQTVNLFLLTSLYEGYGLALVEAEAAGCPIVSTDVGVAREAGATIARFDPADLSVKIIATLRP